MITIPDKVLDMCDKDLLFLYSKIRRKQGKAVYLVTSCSDLAASIGVSKATLWRMLKKMEKMGICETANETANETAKGVRIYTNLQAVTKNKRPPYETANETANETAKPSTLIKLSKDLFVAKYQELFRNPYYWEAKDTVAMRRLIDKITYSRTHRTEPLPTDDSSILTAIGQFLNCIEDPWILEHYSMTVITGKYNEIVQNVKNRRYGIYKQSAAERQRADLASAAETFARLDAERRACLGGADTSAVR